MGCRRRGFGGGLGDGPAAGERGRRRRRATLGAHLLGLDPVDAMGWPARAGVDDATWVAEVVALRDGLRRVRGEIEPGRQLAALGSPALAAGVGLLLQAGVRRTPVLLDGAGAVVCAQLAYRVTRRVRGWWQVAQSNGSVLHEAALEKLLLDPLLRLEVHAEDGTAARLALAVLEAATAPAAPAEPRRGGAGPAARPRKTSARKAPAKKADRGRRRRPRRTATRRCARRRRRACGLADPRRPRPGTGDGRRRPPDADGRRAPAEPAPRQTRRLARVASSSGRGRASRPPRRRRRPSSRRGAARPATAAPRPPPGRPPPRQGRPTTAGP